MFLYQKLIDRSTLRQGFQIPVEFNHLMKVMQGGIVESMNNDTPNIIIRPKIWGNLQTHLHPVIG